MERDIRNGLKWTGISEMDWDIKNGIEPLTKVVKTQAML